MLEVYLDSLYDKSKAKHLSDEQIRDLLIMEVINCKVGSSASEEDKKNVRREAEDEVDGYLSGK